MIEQIERDGMLDLEQAADYKGCSVTTIYNRVRAQRLPDRRDSHGTLLFTKDELDTITIAPPKSGNRAMGDEEPVNIVNTQASSDPAAIKAEILLVSTALGTIGHLVPGFQRISRFEEVRPTIRVWQMEVVTEHGREMWQAVYDQRDVRVMRIDGGEHD